MKLTNYIFSIDKFFFRHLSYNEFQILAFKHSESTEKFFHFITKFGEGYFELMLTIVLLSFFQSINRNTNF